MAKWVPNLGMFMTMRSIGATLPIFRIFTDTPKHLMSFSSQMLPIDSPIRLFDESECMTIPAGMFEKFFGRFTPGTNLMVRLLSCVVEVDQPRDQPRPPECEVVRNVQFALQNVPRD